MPIQATIFSTRSPEGKALEGMLRDFLHALGWIVSVHNQPTQSEFNSACIKQDVVFVDASVELAGTHNYAAFTAQPQAYDHVLVASRTYLPQNFYGLREGGAPPYPFSQNNQAIMAWIREQVADLLPNLPRTGKNIWSTGLRGPLKDLEKARVRASQQHQIFVSFRNSVHKQAKDLQQQLASGKFHQGVKQGVLLLSPGELAYQDEVLSYLQRWEILSIIEEKMRTVKEVWILESDQYYQSWWTSGEMVLMAYFQAVSKRRPLLKVYHPKTQKVEVEPAGVVPELSYEQRRSLDRLLSTAGRTRGAETAQKMREFASIPLIGRSAFFNHPAFSLEWTQQRVFEEPTNTGYSWKNALNPDLFIEMVQPKLIPVPHEVLQQVAQRGATDYQQYSFMMAPHRYIWYATRLGRLNGPKYSDELTIAQELVFRAKKR
ncbi:hypothetical protein [Haliscomenobacter sp.]|uniref:hypothetical protein n=1 Tax=Haliscomenobacter sp. TaxID=2717303 RepID=UPI003BAD8AE0